jgi:hypothetical protein
LNPPSSPSPPSAIYNGTTFSQDGSDGLGLSVCDFNLTTCVVPSGAAEKLLIYPHHYTLLDEIRHHYRTFQNFGLQDPAQALGARLVTVAPNFVEAITALFDLSRALGWTALRFVSPDCKNDLVLSNSMVLAALKSQVRLLPAQLLP